VLPQLGEASGSSYFSKFLLDFPADWASKMGFKWVSILGASRIGWAARILRKFPKNSNIQPIVPTLPFL